MKELFVFEEYIDFISASRNAKEIAIKFNQQTGIERKPNGWAVLVSEDVLLKLIIRNLDDMPKKSYDDINDKYEFPEDAGYDEYEFGWNYSNPGARADLKSFQNWLESWKW